MASVAIRQLHEIQAKHLRKLDLQSVSQRTFISADGTAEKTVILGALRELHVVFLDIAKAVDSVNNHALRGALLS